MWTQTQPRTLVESKHTLTAGGRHPPQEDDQGCERERQEDGGGKPGTEACVRGCRHPPSWEQSPRLTAPDTALTAARCSDLLRGGRRNLHESHSHRLSTSQPGVRGALRTPLREAVAGDCDAPPNPNTTRQSESQTVTGATRAPSSAAPRPTLQTALTAARRNHQVQCNAGETAQQWLGIWLEPTKLEVVWGFHSKHPGVMDSTHLDASERKNYELTRSQQLLVQSSNMRNKHQG